MTGADNLQLGAEPEATATRRCVDPALVPMDALYDHTEFGTRGPNSAPNIVHTIMTAFSGSQSPRGRPMDVVGTAASAQ